MRTPLKALKICALVLLCAAAMSFVVQHLWNWLMPAIFGLRVITLAQALGLLVLSKLLFGGFHRHGHGGRGKRGWKRRLRERCEAMSPEEKEQFRAAWRKKGCHWGEAPEPPQAPGKV